MVGELNKYTAEKSHSHVTLSLKTKEPFFSRLKPKCKTSN